MKYAVDLHIHSALSPCADKDMTPNNIVNMAILKGLDAIAVTDHNTSGNLGALGRCAQKSGLILIPAIEVETAEEIHIVCLFPDIQAANEFDNIVKQALPDIKNRPDIFGRQLIMDENDNIIGEEHRMLLAASGLTIDDVIMLVRKLNGAPIPAHIDRPSYSILSNLGILPQELDIKYLEISRDCDGLLFRSTRPELDRYHLIKSSDAHHLGDILERTNFLELDVLNAEEIIKKLSAKRLR